MERSSIVLGQSPSHISSRRRSSTIVTLLMVGTVVVFILFTAYSCSPANSWPNAYADNDGTSNNPNSGTYNGAYNGTNVGYAPFGYHQWGGMSPWWWGYHWPRAYGGSSTWSSGGRSWTSGSGWSGGASGGGGSSAGSPGHAASGTSRGGFGSSGHASSSS